MCLQPYDSFAAKAHRVTISQSASIRLIKGIPSIAPIPERSLTAAVVQRSTPRSVRQTRQRMREGWGMANVRHNMGTVQEHVVLSCVAAWLCEHSSLDERSVQYIDTHTMAPYGEPVGNDFNCLLHLATQLQQRGVYPETPRGAAAYFQTVLNLYVAHSANRQPRWYPTHFLHAWHAVPAENAKFSAYLFENDDQGAGRRELLKQFIANHDLGGAFNAVLAPAPGSFRESKCWPEPAERASASMLIMSEQKLRRLIHASP
jgi:hypothetical protein